MVQGLGFGVGGVGLKILWFRGFKVRGFGAKGLRFRVLG